VDEMSKDIERERLKIKLRQMTERLQEDVREAKQSNRKNKDFLKLDLEEVKQSIRGKPYELPKLQPTDAQGVKIRPF
jgi:hypothetical protein